MPSYAVLGATGNTGQCLLQVLSQSPENHVRAYCRSKAKLQRLSPDICSNEKFKVYEGDLEDGALIAECISGTRAVFLAVAASENMPGCKIAQDTARVVVAALDTLDTTETPQQPPPRLVVLSSASLVDHLCRDLPRFVHRMLLTAMSHVYGDLRAAETFLRSKSDRISSTFVKPGGLSFDEQRGHQLSTERQQTFVSFMDVAAGMVEVAEAEGDKWDMQNVSVLPTSKNVKFEFMAVVWLSRGLLFHFFPSLYFVMHGSS
ncbi:hypothetical protein MBLNU459_g6357t2 [Dothideomycetes sp. NU459]